MMKKAAYIALLLSLFLIIASCTEKAPHPADTDTSHEGTSDIGTEHPDNPDASLAVIRIETETGQDVISKEEYILSTFSLETEDGRKISASDVKIRGRGNQSWTVPKKSYRLKFPEKISLLSGDEGKNKDWVLIANHCDKSLMRNYIAYSLGKTFEGIEWSPSVELAEVWLNGEYRGVYLLTEQVKAAKNRVAIDDEGKNDDIGFLVELDRYASGEGEKDVDYITVDGDSYTIKSDVETAGQISYLKWYLTCCRDAIREGTQDEVAQLIDLDSLVDMYLLQEYMRNVDAGWSSFYMYIKENGGKLFFGPPWDFDIAAGNSEQVMTDGLYVGNPDYADAAQANSWYQILTERDWFRQLVSERWSASSDAVLKTVCSCLDYAKNRLPYLEKNFEKWDIFSQRINREPDEVLALSSCSVQLDYLGTWLSDRWSFCNSFFKSEAYLDGTGLRG